MKKYRINQKIKELAKETYKKEMLEIENIENNNIIFRTSISCINCSKFLEGFGEYLSMYNDLIIENYINIENPDLLCFINLAYMLGKLENRENIDIDKILK